MPYRALQWILFFLHSITISFVFSDLKLGYFNFSCLIFWNQFPFNLSVPVAPAVLSKLRHLTCILLSPRCLSFSGCLRKDPSSAFPTIDLLERTSQITDAMIRRNIVPKVKRNRNRSSVWSSSSSAALLAKPRM